MSAYRHYLAPLAVLLSLSGWIFDDMVLDREPLIITLNDIDPDPAVAGQVATLDYSGQQNYRCAGVAHRWIVDSKGVVHDLRDVSMFVYTEAASTPVFFARDITIPASAAAGPAVLRIRAERWCNIIQQAFAPTVNTHELKFQIIKR